MRPDFVGGLFAGASEAATSVWADLPAVLVWTLERPGPDETLGQGR